MRDAAFQSVRDQRSMKRGILLLSLFLVLVVAACSPGDGEGPATSDAVRHRGACGRHAESFRNQFTSFARYRPTTQPVTRSRHRHADRRSNGD